MEAHDPEDDRGVAPVVGVILMVAVTVILAAFVGSFVTGYTEAAEVVVPQASFSIDSETCGRANPFQVTHVGGDGLPADELYLRSPDLDLGGSWADPTGYSVTGVSDGTVSAGDTASVCTDVNPVTVYVAWESSTGDRSFILARKTVRR